MLISRGSEELYGSSLTYGAAITEPARARVATMLEKCILTETDAWRILRDAVTDTLNCSSRCPFYITLDGYSRSLASVDLIYLSVLTVHRMVV